MSKAGEEATRVLDHVRLTVAVLLAMLLLLLWWRGYGPYSAAACCAGEAGAGVSKPVAAPAGEPLPPAVTIQPGATEAPAAEAPAAEAPPATVEAEVPVTEAPPATAETESPAAEPPYTVSDPNAQVRTDTVRLPPWEGPQPPAYEHKVYVPPPAPVAAGPEAVTPSVPEEAQPEAPEAVQPETREEMPPEAPAAAAMPDEEPEVSTAPSPAYTIEDPNAQVRTAPSTLPAWTGPRFPEPHHEVYYPPAVAPAATAGTGDVPPAARLYFDTAKWGLPADAGEVLAPIIRYLDEHPDARAVIQGFHDPRGSQELNAALAKNRAGATWAALVAAGIARERIMLRQPADATGSGNLAEARRAEVSILGP